MVKVRTLKKAYKTSVKSTLPASQGVMRALARCHTSVFSAQWQSENDLRISAGQPWMFLKCMLTNPMSQLLLFHIHAPIPE